VNTGVNVTKGPFFVGNTPALGVDFSTVGNPAVFDLTWWDSPTFNTLIAEEIYEFQTGCFMRQTIPILGPWVALTISPTGGAITYTLTMWAAPTRRGIVRRISGTTLISAINAPIGIGVTATNNASEVYVGPAYWSGWQGVANFVAFLEAEDDVGGIQILDRWQGGTVDFSRQVYLPPARCRIRHVNQSGGATSYSSVLLRDPLHVNL
jgi:hypothetical protein